MIQIAVNKFKVVNVNYLSYRCKENCIAEMQP